MTDDDAVFDIIKNSAEDLGAVLGGQQHVDAQHDRHG
jgi:hypothetical protein